MRTWRGGLGVGLIAIAVVCIVGVVMQRVGRSVRPAGQRPLREDNASPHTRDSNLSRRTAEHHAAREPQATDPDVAKEATSSRKALNDGAPGLPAHDSPVLTPRVPGQEGESGRSAGDPSLQSALAYFTNARIPLAERKARVAELGHSKEARAFDTLTALANSGTYLNRAAVQALAGMSNPDAARFVTSKLADVNTHEVTFLCECIRAVGRMGAADAGQAIGRAMELARAREDGHAVPIRKACVEALGTLRQAEAVPVLKAELEHMCAQKRLDLAHGAVIVDAYAAIGAPAAGVILSNYADFLEARMPSEPMPRQYFEEQIADARAVAQALDTPQNAL